MRIQYSEELNGFMGDPPQSAKLLKQDTDVDRKTVT